MRRVALTGGIATGKSYVTRLLRQRAVPTLDADQIARAVVQPGQPAWTQVRQRFGPEVAGADGALDRIRLGRIVFADAAARAALEAIVHPPVQAAIDAWFRRCAASTGAAFAVAEIPLLFETGRAAAFDHVVVVSCAPARQLDRLMARDTLSAAAARQRIAAQRPLADKRAQADTVVHTDGPPDETGRQIDALCQALAAGA